MSEDALQAMDDWCRNRAARLSQKAIDHIEAGGSLDEPDYRQIVGGYRAYIKMRSFIHAARGTAA